MHVSHVPRRYITGFIFSFVDLNPDGSIRIADNYSLSKKRYTTADSYYSAYS